MIVVNRIDHLDAADRDAAVQFIGSALRDLIGDAGSELFAVSARRGEGLSRLALRLRRLASDERETLHRRSVARLARSAATDTAQAARFESRATQLPLEQLDSRAAMFEQRIADLSAAAVEARGLLDRGIERAGADRRRGEQHTRVRLEQLAQIERRCVELATELGAVAAADDHQAGRRVDES